ncbi:MAG: glycosyltransferase, partial [Jiangellaceae bacterium]
VVAVVGGPSGNGLERPEALARLAWTLGVDDIVRFEPPVSQDRLADWYRAADVTVVPSYSESFGLVALESQACGTPVVAAAVGGLRTAVDDGRSGVLVEGHDTAAWAEAIGDLLADPARRQLLGQGAEAHARAFGWDTTADRMLDLYASVTWSPRVARAGELVVA